MIEDYLKIKPNWIWGYIEMADWYDDERDIEHYNLEKAKEILLKVEGIEKIEEIDAVAGANGKKLSTVESLQIGDDLMVEVEDGLIESKITKVTKVKRD